MLRHWPWFGRRRQNVDPLATSTQEPLKTGTALRVPLQSHGYAPTAYTICIPEQPRARSPPATGRRPTAYARLPARNVPTPGSRRAYTSRRSVIRRDFAPRRPMKGAREVRRKNLGGRLDTLRRGREVTVWS